MSHVQGRAFFRGDNNPGRLVLDNISPGDEGLYKCRVDFAVAPTRISNILLDVIVPPEKPRIFDDIGKEVRLKLGPYRLGETVTISCEVSTILFSSNMIWNCFASRISLKSLERTQQGFKAPSSNAELQFDAALLTKHSKLLLISSNLQLLPLYCYSSRKLSIFKKLKSNLESLLTFSPCHCDGLICHLSDDDVSTFTQYPDDTRLASLSCNYLVS